MDNFFDDLKNNLDNRPQSEFEESAWLAMQHKMQPNAKSKNAIGWWWLSWLIVPLIISNGWMYLQWKNANNFSQATQNSTVEIRRDTIFSSKTIYITDTVFQNTSTIVYKNNSSSSFQKVQNLNSFLFSKNSFFKEGFLEKSFADNSLFSNPNSSNIGISNYLNSINQYSKTNSKDPLNSDDGILEKPQNEIFNTSQIDPLYIDLIERNEPLPYYLNLQEEVIYKKNNLRKRWHQITNTMRPKSFHLGVGGGYIYPTNENLSNREGYVLKVQGLIGFSKNLRMWLDFSYLRLHLEGSKLDSEFGIPNIPLPNDDYTFEKASTNRPYLQSSIGMQYLFNAKKRTRPYFGIGYSVVSPRAYEVEYEYFDLLGEEVIIPKDFSSHGIQANQWLINAGLEYKFSEKWMGQIEGFYRSNWQGENNITPNILGLNTKLIFNF